MKKVFTFLFSVFLISFAYAQKPEAVAIKTSVKPIIDGVLEETWDGANVYNVALPFTGETPTLGAEGETNFRVMWDEDGIYVFATVTDDVFIPNFANTGASYMYDFVEITFDVNYILDDGLGPQEGLGHYQIDPKIFQADITGTSKIGSDQDKEIVAFLVNDPNYTAEYFVPFTTLLTADGARFDLTQAIGFDVYVSDNDNTADLNDPIRNRAVWTNQGEVTQAWDNMDNCGLLVLDGAEPPIFVEKITLSAEDITVDGQTMQITSEILPEDATDKGLKWSLTSAVGGGVRATISAQGLITPVLDETIIVSATSTDGFILSNEILINISGQKPTMEDLNYIKNGNFDQVDTTGAPMLWQTGGNAIVTDGVLIFGPDVVLTNPWDYKLAQTTHIPFALKDLDYIISFKAWADAPRNAPLVLEDTYNDGNQYDAYFSSTSEYVNGKTFNIPLTTEPTVFELPVKFDLMQETTIQGFNFQVGKDTPKMHIDSIYIISVADLAILPTAISQQSAMESFRVYPNPASSNLHIEFSSPNATVAIYNSLGIKMDEEVVFGTHHVFDISRYSKGLYFVKANNAVVKFIK